MDYLYCLLIVGNSRVFHGYGLIFNESNFVSKLNEIINNILYIVSVKSYPTMPILCLMNIGFICDLMKIK